MADIAQDELLTVRQQQAVAALLSEPTIGKAAEASGVPVRTLYTWLHDDAAFIGFYQDARRESVRRRKWSCRSGDWAESCRHKHNLSLELT